MYNVDQNEQMLIFFASIGVGFLLGVLYDFLRALRLSFTKWKWVVIVFDLLYFSLVAFLSYIFILATNKGEVRSYIIIGELFGVLFYYFALGIVMMKLTERFVSFLKSFYSLVFKVVSFPFRLLRRLFVNSFGKIKQFLKKSEKKSEKIRKKVLPKVWLYVYNLLGILCVGSKESRKGGKAYGKGEKEKPT